MNSEWFKFNQEIPSTVIDLGYIYNIKNFKDVSLSIIKTFKLNSIFAV